MAADDARPGGIRRSARVVAVDEAGAAFLLLHRWSAPHVEPRWLTVGGGIEPGESERDAAARELLEETGQRAEPGDLIGPVRHLRQPTPPGHRYDALDMTTFVWRTRRFRADASGREPGERAAILDERWWSAAEIAASDDPFDLEDVAGTLALLGAGLAGAGLAGAGLPEPGERVRVRASKWDGTPHWAYGAIALGADEEGCWLGLDGAETEFSRPGVPPFRAAERKVMLVPHRPLSMLEGTWALVHWFADDADSVLFDDVGTRSLLYADIATPPALIRRADGWSLEYTDLDLDVVRPLDRPAWIDDEDEYAVHAERMRYPAWVRERARASADALLEAARAGTVPGEQARSGWHARLDALLASETGAQRP